MSMSMRVVGFIPPDEQWKKMKAAWDSCAAAGIKIPDVVADFFNGEYPVTAGYETSMKGCVREYEDGNSRGFEVLVAEIPSKVKTIRFLCTG